MKQFDIFHETLPTKCDIIVSQKQYYNIVCDNNPRLYDICVYNSEDMWGNFEEGLYPSVLRLSAKPTKCSIDINLLGSGAGAATLYEYDNKLLGILDDFTLFVLDNGNGYSYLPLTSHMFDMGASVYALTKKHTINLMSDVFMSNCSIINTKDNHLSLSTSGDLFNYLSLRTTKSLSNLTSKVAENMSIACELVLRYDDYLYKFDDKTLYFLDKICMSDPNISLSTSQIDLYHRLSLKYIDEYMALNTHITEFVTNIILKNISANTISFEVSPKFAYQVTCGCPQVHALLNISKLPVQTESSITLQPYDMGLYDKISNDIRTHSLLNISSECKLGTFMTDDGMITEQTQL